MENLVPPAARRILESERSTLTRLRDALFAIEADQDDIRRLDDIIDHLEDLFLVVVVGEFNSGKSSFLNALLGRRLLEEGPIPTTDRITLLRFGEADARKTRADQVVERTIPAPLLHNLLLVDTPGTNSVVRDHQRLTESFIPRADLVLFVTSYDRPLSESERLFLEFIRGSWGKRLVVVLNKVDLARDDEGALTTVTTYLRDGFRELLGFEPRIFPVSSALAMAAAEATSETVAETLGRQSRFAALQDFITNQLAGPQQLAIKLQAPLDSGLRLADKAAGRIETLSGLVASDEKRITTFHDELQRRRTDMRDGFRRQLAEVDTLLLEMERRGVQFLDDTIRISGLHLLRKRERFREAFVRQVVRSHETDIERRIADAVDGLLHRFVQLWGWAHSHFSEQARRPMPEAGRESEMAYNRNQVLDAVMREARRRMEGTDIPGEAHRILENARSAAALFLGAEAVAAGIGVVIGVLVVAAGLDVTGGFLASGIVAALGLFVLPRQRKRAIAEFRTRVEALRTEMRQALDGEFDREVEAVITAARDVAAPFERFVADQRRSLDTAQSVVTETRADLESLRTRVEDDFGPAVV